MQYTHIRILETRFLINVPHKDFGCSNDHFVNEFSTAASHFFFLYDVVTTVFGLGWFGLALGCVGFGLAWLWVGLALAWVGFGLSWLWVGLALACVGFGLGWLCVGLALAWVCCGLSWVGLALAFVCFWVGFGFGLCWLWVGLA